MPPKPKPSSALSLTGLLEVAVVLLCLASVAGFLARLWWIFELPTHFRLHFAFALGLLALVWSVKRRRSMAVICCVFALVNAVLVLSVFRPSEKSTSQSAQRLRLVSVNVHTENRRADLVLDFLRKSDADVVLLMEVNNRWMNDLSSLNDIYPHHVTAPREDNFGIALFSRLPLTDSTVVELSQAEVPSITAIVSIGGGQVFLLGTHPLPPGSAEYARLRNEQFLKIAALIRNRNEPAIVLGDLNCTPWSPYFTDLLRDSGLKISPPRSCLFGSWPAWLPFARIPLDHCLVSPGIRVIAKRLGPAVGSDHLPVMVDLQLTGKK
jgi:endonuclease/exonuclease/phosphatase (EEP) superfamily protein YafD